MQGSSMSPRSSKGFTLIELLVVVAIIGILAGVAVGQYRHAIIKSKEAVLKENLFTMRSSINQYFADKGHYPYDIRTLVGQQIVVVANLKPAKLRGVESRGMLLAGRDETGLAVLAPGKRLLPGTRVS